MEDLSVVPRLAADESRMTLHVASLGDAQYLRALDESIVQGCALKTV